MKIRAILVLALFALNNYITFLDHDDFLLIDSFNEEEPENSQESYSCSLNDTRRDREDAKSWRDSIAEKMWIDYCNDSQYHLPVL